MNGSNILADTSLLINFFNGYKITKDVLEGKHIWVSGITEIELLSFDQLTIEEENLIRSFLNDCVIVEINKPIRELTIEIRKKHALKVPDAIIAATSVHLGFPVVTMDTDFKRVPMLNAVIIENE